MEKKIITIALVLLGIISQAKSQDIKFQSHFGFQTLLKSDYNLPIAPVSFFGVEFKDKLGIEYGYSWTLNNSIDDLMNYVYGNSNSYVAGQFTHLVSAYYITNRDEGTAFVIGTGGSFTNVYKAENNVVIERITNPYLKIGLDHQFNKRWNGQLNFAIGGTIAVSLGIKKSL